MKKKICAMSMAVCLSLGLLGGCSTQSPSAETPKSTAETSAEAPADKTDAATAESTPSEKSENAAAEADTGTHTVVDHAGNEVEVPNTIDAVVIDQIPILSTYMAYFNGSAPNIVGYCGSFKSVINDTVLKDIAPELMESNDTVYAQNDLNIEEIIKLEPDVIFYNASNTEHAEILQTSGIPAIGFATTGEDSDPLEIYKNWLTLLEDVFGEEGKTAAFQAAGDEIVADVEARIAEIPEDERPSALILWKYADGVPQVSGTGSFGPAWTSHLGVKDVAADEVQGFGQVSMEQIFSWDPDILFLDGPGLLGLTTDEVLNNEVEGANFSNMRAVQDGRVYGTTLGMWNWFTPNPDAPLVLAWMAYNTHPEAFADYPLVDTIKDYYKTWYGYELSDDEIEEMLVY